MSLTVLVIIIIGLNRWQTVISSVESWRLFKLWVHIWVLELVVWHSRNAEILRGIESLLHLFGLVSSGSSIVALRAVSFFDFRHRMVLTSWSTMGVVLSSNLRKMASWKVHVVIILVETYSWLYWILGRSIFMLLVFLLMILLIKSINTFPRPNFLHDWRKLVLNWLIYDL